MRQFPVKQLTADQIELDGKLLLNNNGDLEYNGNLLAKYEELISVFVVSTTVDFGFLNPKIGDVAKITDTGESFIWNGVWVRLYRSKFSTYTVSGSEDMIGLNPLPGDMVQITNLQKTGIWDGLDWIYVLGGGDGGSNINDLIISLDTAWSSEKIDYELSNHGHDAGTYLGT